MSSFDLEMQEFLDAEKRESELASARLLAALGGNLASVEKRMQMQPTRSPPRSTGTAALGGKSTGSTSPVDLYTLPSSRAKAEASPTSPSLEDSRHSLRFAESAQQSCPLEDSIVATSGLSQFGSRRLTLREDDLRCPALLEDAVRAKRASLPGVAEGFLGACGSCEDYRVFSAPTTCGPSLPRSDDVVLASRGSRGLWC